MRTFGIPITLTAALAAILMLTGAALASPSTERKAAARDFRIFCSSCHGPGGHGDGPVGPELKIPPADLTRIAERNRGVFPKEWVSAKIAGGTMPRAHGTSDMPVWGAVFFFQSLNEGLMIQEAREAEQTAMRRIARLVDHLERLQQ